MLGLLLFFFSKLKLKLVFYTYTFGMNTLPVYIYQLLYWSQILFLR